MGSQDKCPPLDVIARAAGGDGEDNEADDDFHYAFP